MPPLEKWSGTVTVPELQIARKQLPALLEHVPPRRFQTSSALVRKGQSAPEGFSASPVRAG
jgi:hypothetical protein